MTCQRKKRTKYNYISVVVTQRSDLSRPLCSHVTVLRNGFVSCGVHFSLIVLDSGLIYNDAVKFSPLQCGPFPHRLFLPNP